MAGHEADSASESGASGDWEQLASPRNGSHSVDGEAHEDGAGGKKGGKKDLSHVACRFYRVGACTAGANCPFSHSAREPGQTKPPCKWFQKGSCKFGHKCANAHIMPGDPPSMDWKNKKAAKVAQQAEASSTVTGQVPLSPGTATQSMASSPPANGKASTSPQSKQQQPTSGLSSMFGRNGAASVNNVHQSNPRLASVAAENAVAAIGMSPVGLPLPVDMALPTGTASSTATGTESSSSTKPKPFSYASIVGAGNPANAVPASSPNSSKGVIPPQAGSVKASATLRSPSVAHATLPLTSPSAPSAWGINPASPSFVPRGGPLTSQSATSSTIGLSSSVPSAMNMDKLEKHLPSVSSHGMHPQSPQQAFAPSSFQRTPHHHSPLAPPSLQYSHSQSNSIPTRSFLAHGPPSSFSPSISTTAAGQHHRTAIGSPGTSAFGTSPFGNNAIFLSTSHEEDAGSFMARASRAPGVGRGISPARPGFDSQPSKGSLEARMSFSSRIVHGSSALEDDDEDGTEDDNVLEEELVPSSLKHLLTPDEKARRDSRSGAAKSGFFNPFNDTEDDNDDYDQEVAAELRLRYSQSVPATATATSQFNRAPGSPPTFVGYGSPLSSGLLRLGDSSELAGFSNGGPSSNLARHLLTGGTPQGHHVERGFMTTDPANSTSTGNARIGGAGGPIPAFGSSLPQGMAVGLSHLHMIPAGSEHTGYTPPTSFVQSPSARGHLSGTLANASNPGLSSNSPYLAPGAVSRPAPGSSYGIKLPSLLQQQPGAGTRRVSSNHYETAQVHVGSPLARMEIHGHIGSGRDAGSHKQQPEILGHPSSDAEDEDLTFDMDV